MKPRIETALRALGLAPSPEEVLAVIAGYPLSTTQPCVMPGCLNSCAWQVSGGRPALFCSVSCRSRHDRERDVLNAELIELERCLPMIDSVRRRQIVETRIANVHWQLARYRATGDEAKR